MEEIGVNVVKKIIVGISGASGAIYGKRILELLREVREVETHLVLSHAASKTIAHELALCPEDLYALADIHYDENDIGATIASGSFKTEGMIVAPCSVKTLSAIAHSLSDTLLIRAADVTLKERRPLILMVRETPLHLGHIKAMQAVTEMGAIVAPPVPAFYTGPKTIEDIVTQSCARVLDQLGVCPENIMSRWHGGEG